MNELIKTGQTFADIAAIGKAFAESGMFTDIKSAAQAIVKITAGAEMGIPPFASMSGIHIIQGKPTIGAGLLAARVKGSGKYDYRVTDSTDKVCSIDFYQGAEKIGTSTFSIDDAKKAGTKNIDKFPKNMLFARAMSNGVKFYTPDLFAGPVYVPGEIEPIVEDVSHEEIDQESKHAIDTLQLADNLAELSEWKQLTPDFVIKKPEVSKAAKARYNELKAKEVQP